jgi:hypothetical protein
MRRYLLLLLLFFMPFALCSNDAGLRTLKVAQSFIGQQEKSNNSGFKDPKFEEKMKKAGWRKYDSWCAWFQRMCMDIANAIIPAVRSGLAIKYITNKSVSAKDVAKGYVKIGPGYLGIMKVINSYHGHIFVTEGWDKNSGVTIEGNTNAHGGREGIEVSRKFRKIVSTSSMPIVAFTEIK